MVLANRQGEMRPRGRTSKRARGVAGNPPATGARLRRRRALRIMTPGRLGALVAALMLGAAAPSVFAQSEGADLDNLEVTLRLLPQGATRPDPVTRVIELPEALRSRLAESPDTAEPQEGEVADIGGADRRGLPEEALRRPDDGARTDFARSMVERARELGREQGAAASRDSAEPVPSAAGQDAVAAAPAAAEAAAPREEGPDAAAASDPVAAGARDAAAAAREAAEGVRDEAARSAARDSAEAARDDARRAVDGRRQARDASAEAREREREIADRARTAREDAARERAEREESRRGRPEGPPGRR